MSLAPLYACECCGYRTLTESPPGTWLTCPVCGWTDIAMGDRFAENQLHEAQRAFLQHGVCDERAVTLVRPPRPDEPRAAEWKPLPGTDGPESLRHYEAVALIREIHIAFADVSPAGRVSLREAYRADCYGEPPADAVGAEWTDWDQRWSDIPDEIIGYFANCTSVFIFGNAQSFHYYLPPHLAYDLRTREATAVDALLGAEDAHLGLLDKPQCDVVRRYLRYLLDFDGPDERVNKAFARIDSPTDAS